MEEPKALASPNRASPVAPPHNRAERDSALWSQALAAMLGLAGPIAIGTLIHQSRLGIAVALGGLAVSGRGRGENGSPSILATIPTLVAGGLAMFAGSLLTGTGALAVYGILLIAAVAALLGSISRPLARAGAQFSLFTIISANLNGGAASPLGLMLLFGLGAMATTCLELGLRSLARVLTPVPHLRPLETPPQRPSYTVRQLFCRWSRSLAHLTGWQYTLRLTLCLTITQTLVWLWPEHHTYWLSLTVVIVVQRNLATAFTRTWQRAAGTLAGILLTALFLLGPVPAWGRIGSIALLAAARPLLAERNYVASTAALTPLIILLLDFDHPPSPAVIIDRLVATLIGCALALLLGYAGWSRLSPSLASLSRKGRK